MVGTTLLDGITADANGSATEQFGGTLTAYAWAATWGGGTVAFESSLDGGTTWIPARAAVDDDAAAFAANGQMQLQNIGQGAMIRATLSGATNPVGVYAVMVNS